ncbi:MAG: hypothetical protein PHF56_03705 [Desulfuromonadaceae bacterium]|nr:hypothetical protein [Desulfuromonadaceae bacterium]
MAMAALSPNSVLASPIQVNPQVRSDIQGSAPQTAQDAQKTAKVAQTDTITISAQALKMADDKNAAAKKATAAADEQGSSGLATGKADSGQSANIAQKSAVKAYEAVSANR